MTREWQSLKDPRAFLQSPHAKCTDICLISQVEFWSISRRVFEHFGADVESSLASQRSADVEHLSHAYDKWRQDWLGVLTIQAQKSGFAPYLFDFYFNSAKLHLYSHVFRGASQAQTDIRRSDDTDLLGRQAFESALSVVRCAVEGNEACCWLRYMPSYFGTMIAFASICLVKFSAQEQSLTDAKRKESLQGLRLLSSALQTITTEGSITHPLVSLAKGLDTAINSGPQNISTNPDSTTDAVTNDSTLDFDQFGSDFINWNFPGFDDYWTMCPDDASSPTF